MSNYAIAKFPTPVFNTSPFPYHAPQLVRNDQGLIKSIETIAFPETKFKIEQEFPNHVVQVSTLEYLSHEPLYIDGRCLKFTAREPAEREKHLPTVDEILQFMQSLVGTRYFWGGNWAEGILQMQEMYPHLAAPENQSDLLCKGVDCSGLLYQATHGVTPRNTSQLVEHGQQLSVNLHSVQAVQKIVKPLDMLVWKGHMIFILDSNQLIESRGGKGVVISPLVQRYSEVIQALQSENKPFYLRRWHPDLA